MKKIIGMVIASLMFANIGYAEWRVINQKTIKPDHMTYLQDRLDLAELDTIVFCHPRRQ